MPYWLNDPYFGVSGNKINSLSDLDRFFSISEDGTAYGGKGTSAGVSVNQVSSLKLPIIIACLRLKAETFGAMPRIAVQTPTYDKSERLEKGHWLSKILENPNPYIPAMTFWEYAAGCVEGWPANFYAEIEFDREGNPVNLWPLHPGKTEPLILGNGNNSRKVYKTDIDGEEVALPSDRVFHVAGWSINGLKGTPIMQLAAEAIAKGIATQEFTNRFFSGGVNPSMVIQSEGVINDGMAQRLRSSVEKFNSGLSNAHRLMVLGDGLKALPLSFSPDDAKLIEVSEMSDLQLARMLRVPPPLVGIMTGMTYTNVENLNIQFVITSMDPLAKRFQSAIALQLIGPKRMGKWSVNFSTQELLMGEFEARMTALASGVTAGIMTRDEARANVNLAAHGTDGAKILTVQQQIVDLEGYKEINKAQQEDPPEEAPPAPQEEV